MDEDLGWQTAALTPREWGECYPSPGTWLRANMVASVDGAATIGGRVGDLTGSADQDVLIALRMLADVVLVGAGTVRAEGYGPIDVDEDWVAHRRDTGLAPVPPLAIVSNSGELDTSAPVFTDAAVGPILIVPENCPRLDELRAHGEVITAGVDSVDLAAALDALRERGCGRVLCEGGPTLLGDLVEADLLDELCLAISPTMVGGVAGVAPRPEGLRGLRLEAVRRSGDYLFLRYLLRD